MKGISLYSRDGSELTFPLPPARSDMCRDAFLKELLEPFETLEDSEESSEELAQPMKHLQFGEDDEDADDVLLKELLLGHGSRTGRMTARMTGRMTARMTARSTGRMTQMNFRRSTVVAPDILKIMQERQLSIFVGLGFVGVLFELAELKNRLRVLRELWKVDINLDKSFRMFSWSHRDYYSRFSKRNTTYLDITERTLGDQKECYKFNIDIREISRLLDAIDDDIRQKRDLCDNSMLLLNEAKLDIEQVLMETRKKVEEVHANTVLEVCRMPRSADPDQSIRYEVNKKINNTDFLYPIEARYRIKWAETQAEQFMSWNDREYNKMVEELTHLQTITIESSFIWQSSSTAYEMQIAGLKKRIANLEAEYDRRISDVEDEKKVLENKLQQAVEDYVKCKEAIPFFHQRIAEVNFILYPPVEEEEQEPEEEPVKTKKKGKEKKEVFLIRTEKFVKFYTVW